MDRHYDARSEFFASFLDSHYRAYSMAYYGETAEAVRNSSATLEEAQKAKFSLIAKRAQIEGHERIINLGCGFGSFETFLLQEYSEHYGCWRHPQQGSSQLHKKTNAGSD